MKKLIALSVVLFSINTFAAVGSTESMIRPEGLFEYNQLSVTMVRDYEVVPQQNTARVNQLLADHYECRMVASFFKCQKFLKDMDLPGILASKINNEWEKTKVIFKKSATDPVLTNEAEAITEWDVFDTVSINSERAEMYHYYLINADLHKLKIETQNAVYYPLLLNEKQISFPVETSVTSGRFNWKTYNVDVIFRKKL